jgi:hypothetical protein
VLVNFPLLVIPFALYNMIAFLMPGTDLKAAIFSVNMMSGGVWPVSLHDILIIFTLFLLFFEIVKSTRAVSRSIVDHGLALLLFIVAMMEFILVPKAATSTFAILMTIFLLDVVAGYAVSLRVAQRDVTVEKVSSEVL